VRTPRGKGKKDGSLHQARRAGLAAAHAAAGDAAAQLNLDTALVDDVVLGCVTPVGEQGADIARTAVLDAEWAQTVAGVTQSRFCASGPGVGEPGRGQGASGLGGPGGGGGVESMSRWAMGSDGGAWVMDPRINQKLGFVPQGVGADLIATLEGWSRADVDAFALRSHQRAAAARAEGASTAVRGAGAGHRRPAAAGPRTRPSAPTPARRHGQAGPSFAMMGQMGFDATALRKYTTVERIEPHAPRRQLVGHRRRRGADAGGLAEAARKAGLKPRARIRAAAVIGSEPTIMLTGPTPACRKALAKAGMAASDIDLWEVNEAFAVVPMKTARDLGVDLDRVNVNGGAIAMGHPLGATGCIILGTLLDELERRNLGTGLRHAVRRRRHGHRHHHRAGVTMMRPTQ
jgi:acetyl-CoA C-acetyltransferase